MIHNVWTFSLLLLKPSLIHQPHFIFRSVSPTPYRGQPFHDTTNTSFCWHRGLNLYRALRPETAHLGINRHDVVRKRTDARRRSATYFRQSPYASQLTNMPATGATRTTHRAQARHLHGSPRPWGSFSMRVIQSTPSPTR